jgi:hypothetical protein
MFDKIYQCSIADDDIHHQISSSGQFPDARLIATLKDMNFSVDLILPELGPTVKGRGVLSQSVPNPSFGLPLYPSILFLLAPLHF